jgi:hypothetical protein
MFEIVIFCVIVLAAGYWVAMFVMGRHDDVIHGKFVHSEEEGEFAAPTMPTPPPRFPNRPRKEAAPAKIVPVDEVAPRQVTSEALQSLLAAIQQDLKSVA